MVIVVVGGVNISFVVAFIIIVGRGGRVVGRGLISVSVRLLSARRLTAAGGGRVEGRLLCRPGVGLRLVVRRWWAPGVAGWVGGVGWLVKGLVVVWLLVVVKGGGGVAVLVGVVVVLRWRVPVRWVVGGGIVVRAWVVAGQAGVTALSVVRSRT